jgi:signal transduction histidine kinase
MTALLRTCGRGLGLAATSLFGGIGVLVVTAVTLGVARAPMRQFAEAERRRAWAWSGVRIGPNSVRDLGWTAANIPVGFALGLLPAVLLADGVWGMVAAPILWIVAPGPYWPIAIVLGAVTFLLAWRYHAVILRGHAWFSAALLGPPREQLEARVGELAESRADVVDASAAELRRIERDLHDGAQARLVALGMNIGLAEQLLLTDPAAAAELLIEARAASGEALAELRRLVRGLHPPVLAERGLVGAVEALALSLPVPVDVDAPDRERVPAPLEAALYFAIAETLANMVKHSGASRAWVRIRRADRRIVAAVGDNGRGSATEDGPGGGLAGVRRRMAAFDGSVDVASPPGGPTVITMEVPCGS